MEDLTKELEEVFGQDKKKPTTDTEKKNGKGSDKDQTGKEEAKVSMFKTCRELDTMCEEVMQNRAKYKKLAELEEDFAEDLKTFADSVKKCKAAHDKLKAQFK